MSRKNGSGKIAMPRFTALFAALLVLAVFVGSSQGNADASTTHSIASAEDLVLNQLNDGGGGPIDFWLVTLVGGDEVQLNTNQPGVVNSGDTVFDYELFAPGTSDTSFTQTPPVDATSTSQGSTQDVLDLQAPYSATFVLAVCENPSTADCRNVDSGGGVNPMQSYTFTPTLVGGGIAPSVGATEVRAGNTIASATSLTVGDFEAGGGGPVDFWLVTLVGGDEVQLNTNQRGVVNNGDTVFDYELFAPGTSDTSFTQTPPVDATSTSQGSTQDVLDLQAPYSATFVLAVCENPSTADCRNVDSGGGVNPMQSYTFTPTLVGGGIAPSVGATEVRAGNTIASATSLTVGDFEAGGGGPVDFWLVTLVGGDEVQLNTNQRGVVNNGDTVFDYELFPPGTTDTSFSRTSPIASTATSQGTTKDILDLEAPSSGTFLLAVCENPSTADCRSVDSGGAVNPMQPYTFTPILVSGSVPPPVLPEAPTVILLPVLAAVITSGFVLLQRRRSRRRPLIEH